MMQMELNHPMSISRPRGSVSSSHQRKKYSQQSPQQPHQQPRGRCCCRGLSVLFCSHVGLCILIIGYSVLGAFTFKYLEAPHEKAKLSQVIEMRDSTVKRLWNITFELNVLYKDNWTRLVSQEISRFQTELVVALKDGYDGNETQISHQWSFFGAFLYSLTVLTTIGYGNIAPRTSWGKLATIIYAIVGIPLMFLFLTNVGNNLARAMRCVYGKLCRRSKSHKRRTRPHLEQYQVHHIVLQDTPPPPSTNLHNSVDPAWRNKLNAAFDCPDPPPLVELEDDPPKVQVPITLCILLIVAYICGGAGLFSYWEGWNFLDGSYFCFVTLSTIGFGDFVPGSTLMNGSQEKLILCSVYLLGGLSLIAMSFNLVQDQVIRGVRTTGRCLGLQELPDP